LFWKKFQIFIFVTFQNCSGTVRRFSKVFRNILICLVDCPIFKMFRNFQFIQKHSDLVWKYLKKYSRTFRYFFKKKVFLKRYNLFSRLFCYQNVLKHSDLFGNIPDYFENISNPPKHSNECRHSNYSGTIWNVIMSNFIIYRLFSKQIWREMKSDKHKRNLFQNNFGLTLEGLQKIKRMRIW